MLVSGREKLERMRDGGVVYIGRERVGDVTTHPAFRNCAQTIAALYDLKADASKGELFTYEENGERFGLQWLRCRNRDVLLGIAAVMLSPCRFSSMAVRLPI